jgi:hypothetical protein
MPPFPLLSLLMDGWTRVPSSFLPPTWTDQPTAAAQKDLFPSAIELNFFCPLPLHIRKSTAIVLDRAGGGFYSYLCGAVAVPLSLMLRLWSSSRGGAVGAGTGGPDPAAACDEVVGPGHPVPGGGGRMVGLKKLYS